MLKAPILHSLSFFPSPSQIIKKVSEKPNSFFLDSSDPFHPASRYSYVGVDPFVQWEGSDDPWPQLEKTCCHLPGTLMGYLAFENHQYLENATISTKLKGPIPLTWFASYDPILVLDHKENRAFLKSWWMSMQELKKEEEKWLDLMSPPSLEGRELEGGWSRGHPLPNPLPSREREFLIPLTEPYIQKILKIKEYLKAGDVYQINYTERFEADADLPADLLYQRLRQISPAPYSAFLNAGSFQILSASPELFFQTDGETILTKPIKGTIKRLPESQADRRQASILLASVKDRAELLMIVDLERNDLGKICEYGSITVHPVFSVESFAQVHHLVASVRGRLKKGMAPVGMAPVGMAPVGMGPIEILKNLFPGGSITGAPKIRALQIIDELEEKPRSVYTGALGLIEPDGKALFNMPIRTLTKVGKKVYFHAGGGITIDSDPEKEYEEMMLKAEGMIRALRGS